MSSVVMVCEQCNKAFTVPARVYKEGRKYCSRECSSVARRTREKRNCRVCGKEFIARGVQIRNGDGLYCSTACLGQSHRKTVYRICQYCGNEFTTIPSIVERGDGIFCSIKCQHENTKNQVVCVCENCGIKFFIKKSKKLMGRGRFCSVECYHGMRQIERQCKWCGKEFVVKKSLAEKGFGIFCAQDCYTQSVSGENSPQWRGGLSFEPYPSEFNGRYKRMIRERDDYNCAICRLWGNCVHHVNYQKDDMSPLTKIVLCHNCHSTTNADRTYWQQELGALIQRRITANASYVI